jgi:hypothetical protein
MHRCEYRKISLITETSEQLQCFLSGVRQSSQPADHEIQKIVVGTLVGDAVEVPRPGSLVAIEREKMLLSKACEKLAREKRPSSDARGGRAAEHPPVQGEEYRKATD